MDTRGLEPRVEDLRIDVLAEMVPGACMACEVVSLSQGWVHVNVRNRLLAPPPETTPPQAATTASSPRDSRPGGTSPSPPGDGVEPDAGDIRGS